MNNYLNFKNYDYNNLFDYNEYSNLIKQFDNLNKQENESSKTLYDPYNGLIRGNLFKELYVPYLSNEPYEIKPMNEQAKQLTEIDSLAFALTDLNLFLDINPDNKEAIDLFNKYKSKKEELTKDYEKKYGPITLESNALNSYPWAWINMPWPWDN